MSIIYKNKLHCKLVFFGVQTIFHDILVLGQGSATWYTTHVCSKVSTTIVSDPLLL
jgi:hypothetical protein